MGRGQNRNINRSLEEGGSSSHGCLWGFKTLEEEVNADILGITRELELQVEPEDGIELLQYHNRTFILCMSKESGFLRWNLLLVEMLQKLLKWQQKI